MIKENIKENKNLKVAFNTLGCKSNRYDTIKLQEVLKHYPIEIVPFDEKADLYIVNTCAVTNNSEVSSRKVIRKAKRTNKESDILVTGCYAQIAQKELEEMKETSFVINNLEKDNIAKFIKNHFFSNLPDLPESVDYVNSFSNQTRPFIKIQDGCKSFCTYCIIPYTRPIMKSLKKESVARQINLLANQGYKEIVLTGIHLGYYGEDLSEDIDFIGLLKYLEDNTTIERIRISSIDPHEVTKEFVDVVANSKKIQNQLHIALQYGDDKILNLMKREYNTKQLLENLDYATKKIKNLLYGFDIIVGFPYETDETFENTKNILLKTKPGYLHVFPYSKRSYTKALDYDNHIEHHLIKKRAKILRELGKKLKAKRMQDAIGTVDSLLIERKFILNGVEYFRGHTSTFFDVIIKKTPELSDNIIIDVKLDKILNENIIIATLFIKD